MKRKIPALMFQGTSSNAGKSVLTAAMCRILLQDGLSVAPFKAQNMALNSFVTPDGREIGRAQAVQAAACRLEPDVRMNPVLLKPSSDTGSQVVVNGRPVGNMRVGEYVRYKPEAFKAVTAAYDSLSEEHNVMVIEGAGSPAEINLKAHDIVNMRMAKYADAKVILVGDIDRGGVFASLVGTMELLDEWERDLVGGFLLNRFRGDASLLDSALEYTTRRTGKPFLGVVPHVPALGLPEEDSVTFKQEFARSLPAAGCGNDRGLLYSETEATDTPESWAANAGGGAAGGTPRGGIDIAVIDLPHIANFTDLDAFAIEPDVSLRLVQSPYELGRPDVILLPGSKNTVGDMKWLRQSGLEREIVGLAEHRDVEVVGICGGFQMLGEGIRDPLAVESSDAYINGLSLLPLETSMCAQKTLARTVATHVTSGLRLTGYEIHHGETVVKRDVACLSQMASTSGSHGEQDRQCRDASSGVHFDAHENAADSAGSCAGSHSPTSVAPFVSVERMHIAVQSQGRAIGYGCGNVWGTYLHGLFDDDVFRRAFIDTLHLRKGNSPIGRVVASYSIDPALDRLAEIVRQSVDMRMVYALLGM